MESTGDPSSLENSEGANLVSVEDHHQAPGLQVRSFECTFCKRGFSSAQALGGHMNIHRKDRAKLKQINETQLGLDLIAKSIPSYDDQGHVPSHIIAPDHQATVHSDDGCSFYKYWPRTFPAREEAETRAGGELRQLQLFDDLRGRQAVAQTGVQEIRRSHPNHGSAGEKLDLELRLGPEP